MNPHNRQIVATASAPEAVGPYSQAVLGSGLLFCSGQLPIEPATGEIVEGGSAEQAAVCLRNLEAVCQAAGASLADALRLTVYVTRLEDFPSINETYAGFFQDGPPPARVTVGVGALPKGALVEIDAIVDCGN